MNLLFAIFRIFFVVLFINMSMPSNTFGQMKVIKQREILLPTVGGEPDFIFKNIGNGSVLIIEKLEESKEYKLPIYTFKKINSDLETVWEKTVEIPYEFHEDVECITPNTYYIGFGEANSLKINILKVDLVSGETEFITGDLIGIDTIFQLKVIGNTAFFNGKFHGRDVIVSYSFFDKKVKALTGFYSNHMEIVNIESDLKLNLLNVLVKNRYKRACELQLKTFDENGLLIKSVLIENDENKLPIRGKVYYKNEKETIVFGDYSRFCDPLAQGIFSSKQVENTIEKTQFNDFSDLKNFLNYTNFKKTERLKMKMSKKKKTGKSFKFSYPLLMHDLYRIDNEIIMVFEMYSSNPKGTLATTGFLGNQISNFNNYDYTNKFTHFLFFCFDNNGKLIWDNNIPLKNLDSYDLEKKANIIFENGKIIVSYAKDGSIEYTVLEKGKKINDIQKLELLSNKRNNFSNNEIYELLPFDKESMLAWGFKQESENPINGKKVLFINKLQHTFK